MDLVTGISEILKIFQTCEMHHLKVWRTDRWPLPWTLCKFMETLTFEVGIPEQTHASHV
jgi:hypothetical protein